MYNLETDYREKRCIEKQCSGWNSAGQKKQQTNKMVMVFVRIVQSEVAQCCCVTHENKKSSQAGPR